MQNGELKIGELPELKIVSVDEIFPHEEFHPVRTKRIASRIQQDQFLKNPLIVASVKGISGYILLDGSNRLQALKELNIPYVCVQIVHLNDPSLEINTWHHAVERLPLGRIREKIRVKPRGTNVNNFCCLFTTCSGECYAIPPENSLWKKVEQLHKVVNSYNLSFDADRVSYTNLGHLKSNYPEFSFLVSFKPFSKDEILYLASNGYKIPGGITRIVLPKRALHLNIPLSLLGDNLSLEKKNQILENDLLNRVREKSIRFYREPVFIFDE